MQAGVAPLDGQLFVSATKRTLGAMRADADQANQAVQIEAAHGRRVIARPELALGEHSLRGERNPECESRRDRGNRGAGRIEPGERRSR